MVKELNFLNFYIIFYNMIIYLAQKNTNIIPPSYEESLEEPPPYTLSFPNLKNKY